MINAVSRLLLAVVIFSFAPAVGAPAPLDVFAQLEKARNVTMSPNGKYFAMIETVDDQDYMAVYDIDSRKRVTLFAADDPNDKSSVHPEKRTRIDYVRWFSDDRLELQARIMKKRVFGGREYVTYWSPMGLDCRVIFVNRDGTQPIGLAGCGFYRTISNNGPDADTMVVESGSPGRTQDSADLTQKASTVNAFHVNTKTGEIKLVERGNSRTGGWIADRNGNVRIRIDYQEGKAFFFHRAPGSSEWVEAGTAPYRPWERNDDPGKSFAPSGFTSNPNEVILSYTLNDRAAIGVYDLTQKKVVRTLFSDPKFDFGGLLSDRDGKVLGAGIVRWRYEQEYTDPEYQALQREVRATFPSSYVLIAGLSKDKQRALVYVEGAEFPGGGYTFLDFANGQGFTLVNLMPGLTESMIGKTSVINYTARDGRKIDAYLTNPQGSSGKNMPAIIMPHGGPHARDVGGFDFWADFLANRGYSVLRPQFRGSRGFGIEHLEAGRYQWGLKMQDDVTDGVKHMIATGAWDPKRICIFGWSYGGYAAMAGATMTPELYRCVVAGAGVSDLVEIVQEEEKFDPNNFAADFWRKTIGSAGKDTAKLRAASPANLVDRVLAPILLIHGKWDATVLVNQSEIFARALERAKKPFEFVVLEKEDHYLFTQAGRTKMFQSMEAFLLKHNPPN